MLFISKEDRCVQHRCVKLVICVCVRVRAFVCAEALLGESCVPCQNKSNQMHRCLVLACGILFVCVCDAETVFLICQKHAPQSPVFHGHEHLYRQALSVDGHPRMHFFESFRLFLRSISSSSRTFSPFTARNASANTLSVSHLNFRRKILLQQPRNALPSSTHCMAFLSAQKR